MSYHPAHPYASSSSSHSASISSSYPPRIKRTGGTWTEEEDARLFELVEALGDKQWVQVANGFNNIRDKKQCRERWCNHVNPRINNSPFSTVENIYIVNFYIRHGGLWAKMSKSGQLPNRPDNAIKNHFNTNLLPIYLELCQEYNLARRRDDNTIQEVESVLSIAIQTKLASYQVQGSKGVKASRFLGASSGKIDRLVQPASPCVNNATIMERRRRSNTLQNIHTSSNHSLRGVGLGSSPTGMIRPGWKTASFEKIPSFNRGEGLSQSPPMGPQWHLPQNRTFLTPTPVEEAGGMDWSGSDYSAPSPSMTRATSSHGCGESPSTSSELSLAEADDRCDPHSQHQVSKWCDSRGNVLLPPPTPSTLFAKLSCQDYDEQQKALLTEMKPTRHERESPFQRPRSLLFSPR